MRAISEERKEETQARKLRWSEVKRRGELLVTETGWCLNITGYNSPSVLCDQRSLILSNGNNSGSFRSGFMWNAPL